MSVARKRGIKVDRGLKDQIEQFGEGRQETFKRNPLRLRSVSKNTIRLKSASRHPIRLRSVAKGNPSSSAKAKPKPKPEAKAKARTLARQRRGPVALGHKVHGRALK